MLAVVMNVEILFAAGWWVIAILVFFAGLALKREAGSDKLIGFHTTRMFGTGIVVAAIPIAALAVYCTIWAICHASW